MKYRRLEKEELAELETEFIRFLAANSITADDWTQLKSAEVEKANALIDLFSDIVFDKILEKVEFLEQREKHTIRIFKFDEEKITMNGMTIQGSNGIDLTQDQDPQTLMQLFQLSPGKMNIFTAEKKYKKDKLLEIFDLMQHGCMILKDPTLFDTIEKLKK